MSHGVASLPSIDLVHLLEVVEGGALPPHLVLAPGGGAGGGPGAEVGGGALPAGGSQVRRGRREGGGGGEEEVRRRRWGSQPFPFTRDPVRSDLGRPHFLLGPLQGVLVAGEGGGVVEHVFSRGGGGVGVEVGDAGEEGGGGEEGGDGGEGAGGGGVLRVARVAEHGGHLLSTWVGQELQLVFQCRESPTEIGWIWTW